MIVKHCQSVIWQRLSSIPTRNQIINYYSSFKPINFEEISTEFQAYGNGQIDFKTENNIGIIKLNNPEKKNAVSGKMMSEFYNIMTSLEKGSYPKVKGLILTGEGDFFCAGGDKEMVRKLTHLTSTEMAWKMTCLMHETVKKLYTIPALSVALVNGRGLGGGAELCLATDLRIFAEKSGKLSFVQVSVTIW